MTNIVKLINTTGLHNKETIDKIIKIVMDNSPENV